MARVINSKVQSIRGICIIGVILIHVSVFNDTDSLNNYWIIYRRIINFPVTIFFFISGYFINVENAKSNL